MSSYKLLHEADGLEEQVAKKYEVPTYTKYLTTNLKPMSKTNSWSEVQSLAFTLVYFMHCFKEKPRAIVINRKKALALIQQEGEVPKTIEGIPLAFDENQHFKQTCLA